MLLTYLTVLCGYVKQENNEWKGAEDKHGVFCACRYTTYSFIHVNTYLLSKCEISPMAERRTRPGHRR